MLNGERVKLESIIEKEVKVIGVRVTSVDGRWNGFREIRRSPAKGEVLRKPSVMEGRTVRFEQGGVVKTGRVGRKQVPLVLELALTVHKGQGAAITKAVVDMGCSREAYVEGLFYTAITRATSLSLLFFIDVPSTDEEILARVKSIPEARREMEECFWQVNKFETEQSS